MRISATLLLLSLAACGESEPTPGASMSATVDGRAWRAGGEGHNPPTASYYSQSGKLLIFGLGDRPEGEGWETVTLTIATGGIGGTYLVGDTSSGSHARVDRVFGNLIDTTSYTEVFLTNQSATGQAVVTLDLDGRHTTGSFSFNATGGRVGRTFAVSGGPWDLPVVIINSGQ